MRKKLLFFILSMFLVPMTVEAAGGGRGENNSASITKRTCSYGSVVVTVKGDGSVSARSTSSDYEIRIADTSDANAFSNDCPANIYVSGVQDSASGSYMYLKTTDVGHSYTKMSIRTDCDSVFGDPEDIESTAYWLQFALNIMKYIAIVSLLGFSTLDFFKALVQNDKDALQKAGKTSFKRLIYCILIFFLPYIVSFLMDIVGAYGTCGVK